MNGQNQIQVPDEYLMLVDDSASFILPHLLRITIELGIAERVASGPQSATSIAKSIGASPDAVCRLLRALATLGFFRTLPSGDFALGPLGARIIHGSNEGMCASLANSESQRAWLLGEHSIRSGRPAFESACGDQFFAHKQGDVVASTSFTKRMSERWRRLYAGLPDAVDWSQSSSLIDIGGGLGGTLHAILDAAPHMNVSLFEQPHVIEAITPDRRVELIAGDFFEWIPDGADTHLMCSVLHDWPDEQASLILRNSRRALKEDGRLLVVEMLVPSDDCWHPSKWSDLGMLILTGGRERSEGEFQQLFDEAGYQLISVAAVPNSYFSVLTAV